MYELPSPEQVQRYGKFLGYDQYDPVFLFDKERLILLDTWKNNKLSYKVYRWYGSVATLVKGYSEFNGEPIIREDNPDNDFYYSRKLGKGVMI